MQFQESEKLMQCFGCICSSFSINYFESFCAKYITIIPEQNFRGLFTVSFAVWHLVCLRKYSLFLFKLGSHWFYFIFQAVRNIVNHYFFCVLHSVCAKGLQNILEIMNYSKYKEFGRVVLMQMKLALFLYNNCFH